MVKPPVVQLAGMLRALGAHDHRRGVGVAGRGRRPAALPPARRRRAGTTSAGWTPTRSARRWDLVNYVVSGRTIGPDSTAGDDLPGRDRRPGARRRARVLARPAAGGRAPSPGCAPTPSSSSRPPTRHHLGVHAPAARPPARPAPERPPSSDRRLGRLPDQLMPDPTSPPPAAARASPAPSSCAAAPPPPAAACARSRPACRCPPAPACRGARSCRAPAGSRWPCSAAPRWARARFEAGIAAAEAAGEDRVLVSIFCSGGLDSLSLLAPVGDARYATLRGALALGADPALRVRRGHAPALAPDRRAAARPARRGQAERDPGDRLRRPQPVALHLAPLLGGRRASTRPAASAGSAATSTATAPTTTRCRACRSTTRSRRRWRPPAVPVAAVAAPESYDLWARDVWDSAMFDAAVTRWGGQGALATADAELAAARRAAGMSTALRTQLAGAAGPHGRLAGRRPYPAGTNAFPQPARVAGGDDRARPAAAGRRARRQRRLRHAREPGRDAAGQPRAAVGARWPPSRPTSRRAASPTACSCTSGASSAAAPQANGSGTDHGAGGASFVMGTQAKGAMVGEFPGLGRRSTRGQPAPHGRLPRASTGG